MIDDLWYKNGVIYCLSVGTYMDANGDGIGDFRGLLRRLDYLHGLGITAIWLMPFRIWCGEPGLTVLLIISIKVGLTIQACPKSKVWEQVGSQQFSPRTSINF